MFHICTSPATTRKEFAITTHDHQDWLDTLTPWEEAYYLIRQDDDAGDYPHEPFPSVEQLADDANNAAAYEPTDAPW